MGQRKIVITSLCILLLQGLASVDAKAKNEKEEDVGIGKRLETIAGANQAQDRFRFLSDNQMKGETLFGIKDTYLTDSSKWNHFFLCIFPLISIPIIPILGKAVLRVKNGGAPRVEFNPKGYPTRKNPPVAIPKSLATTAPYVQKTLQTAGTALTYAAIAVDSVRLGSAAITDAGKCASGKGCVPEESVKTASSITSTLGAAYVGGKAGAIAGSLGGSVACAALGPAAIPCVAVTTIVGSIYGASKAVELASEPVANTVSSGINSLIQYYFS